VKFVGAVMRSASWQMTMCLHQGIHIHSAQFNRRGTRPIDFSRSLRRKGFMNEKVQSYLEWVVEMKAAGHTPNLTEERYNKEAAQCHQADLNPPKFRQGSTWSKWNKKSRSAGTSYGCLLSSGSVNQMFARTHGTFTRKICCSG
jgi:hypothetical protein